MSNLNFRKKPSSISPKNMAERNISHSPAQNQKNYRSISIYMENNTNEISENAMKNEDLMLKILQPLNCDDISKAKKFTELKGVFNSLIMISPTKNLTKIADGFANRTNVFKKNKKKI